jgi:hypothetical protein
VDLVGLAQDRKTVIGSIHSNGALHIDRIGFSNKQLTGNFAGHYFWINIENLWKLNEQMFFVISCDTGHTPSVNLTV